VLLSGGMSRIPCVGQRLAELSGPTTAVTSAADPPETAVVLGLAAASGFHRTTRYALGYDIVLDWDGGSCPLYEAHMPILETWWFETDQPREFRFLCTGRGLGLPSQGLGRLRVEGNGRHDPSLGGESLHGHPVALNGEQFELAIYPSGRLRMVDGAGVHEGRTRD